MLVLGLNVFHADSAAALVRDGEVVAAVAEERLNRIKHFSGLPKLAIDEVLRLGGVTWDDLDAIAIGRDSKANRLHKYLLALRKIRTIGRIAKQRLGNRKSLASVPDQLREIYGSVPQLHVVEHHLAHAASTFLPSPFEEAAVLTIDGFGDFASTTLGVGKGDSLKIHKRVLYPHSVGVFYTSLCQFIGYDRYGDEGKIMGLAPYGDPKRYAKEMAELISLTPDGGFKLKLSAFDFHSKGVDYSADETGLPRVGRLFNEAAFAKLFGGPSLKRGDELSDRERDIAASLQARLEEVYLHVLNHLQISTGMKNVCMAGGVALNSVANGMILEHTGFERFYAHPAPGDDGTAVGAALWACRKSGERKRLRTASLGSEYTDDEIRAELTKHADSLVIEECDRETLIDRAADAVASGKVTGWFQGKMEWGPRALGNRSIIAHPGYPGMRDLLNSRIKHRESFRPFALSICQDATLDYLHANADAPFMLQVFTTKEDKRASIQAVDHVNHTARIQTVERDTLPLYYDMMRAVEKRVGVPAVLNTSFNENEPIVCTPKDGVECFLRTKMDHLAMGSFWCSRKDDA